MVSVIILDSHVNTRESSTFFIQNIINKNKIDIRKYLIWICVLCQMVMGLLLKTQITKKNLIVTKIGLVIP